MDQMVTVLEPLQIATTALCETEIVSCSLIYPVINGLLKSHLVPGKSDLPTVKRFKEVVAQDIERRFNVSEAVKEQNVAIFATILDPGYHQQKFMDYSTKQQLTPCLKNSWLYYLVKESVRLFKRLLHNHRKERKRKLLWLFYLEKMKMMTLRCLLHQNSLINI